MGPSLARSGLWGRCATGPGLAVGDERVARLAAPVAGGDDAVEGNLKPLFVGSTMAVPVASAVRRPKPLPRRLRRDETERTPSPSAQAREVGDDRQMRPSGSNVDVAQLTRNPRAMPSSKIRRQQRTANGCRQGEGPTLVGPSPVRPGLWEPCATGLGACRRRRARRSPCRLRRRWRGRCRSQTPSRRASAQPWPCRWRQRPRSPKLSYYRLRRKRG